MSDVEVKDYSGNALGLFNDSRLPVDAITEDVDLHNLRSHAYNFIGHMVATTPSGAGVEFLYLSNDSTTDQIVVTNIWLYAASAEDVIVGKCTGTPASGVAITPTNRLLGSAVTASDVTLEKHTSITGLTPVTSDQIHLAATTETDILRGKPLVLMPSTAMSVTAVAGSIAINGSVWFYQAKHPTAA
jgi:hypothetical protein